jgi:hypothetical protein
MKLSKYFFILMISAIILIVLPAFDFTNAATMDQATPDNNTGISGSQSVPTKSNIFILQNPLNKNINSVGDLIQAFIEIITYLFIIFAVLMFIYVGFQYVTNAAQGNAKKIEELHKQLLWLVVGVAVVIGARVIIQVVINTISATGTVNPSVIESANKAAQGR